MKLDSSVVVELRSGERSNTGLGTTEDSSYIDPFHNRSTPQLPRERQKEQKGFKIPRLRELLGLGR